MNLFLDDLIFQNFQLWDFWTLNNLELSKPKVLKGLIDGRFLQALKWILIYEKVPKKLIPRPTKENCGISSKAYSIGYQWIFECRKRKKFLRIQFLWRLEDNSIDFRFYNHSVVCTNATIIQKSKETIRKESRRSERIVRNGNISVICIIDYKTEVVTKRELIVSVMSEICDK